MRFGTIIVDPPWAFDDKLQKMKSKTKRGAQSQYSVLTVDDIAALNVASLADPTGCVLALWTPSTFLPAGLHIMNEWGFNFKTTVCWVKGTKTGKLGFGMGRLFRASHELALIGTLGKVYKNLENHSQRSAFLAPNKGHSIKPDDLHHSLEAMFPSVNKLEMFSRRQRPGWTVTGLDVDGRDVRQAIQDLEAL